MFTLQVSRDTVFWISGQNCDPCNENSLDLFHDTVCVQAHLNVYYQITVRPNFGSTQTGQKF